MAFTLVDSVSAGAAGGTAVTTGNIDTTGAILLVAAVSWFVTAGDPVITDSYGNTWVPFGSISNSALTTRRYWAAPVSGGAGHNFSVNGVNFPSIAVAAFSGTGSATTHLDEVSNSRDGQSTIQPGSLTPLLNDALFVTHTGVADPAQTMSLSAPFSLDESVVYNGSGGSQHQGVGIGHYIQSVIGAENPTWTFSGNVNDLLATMSMFIDGLAGTTMFLTQEFYEAFYGQSPQVNLTQAFYEVEYGQSPQVNLTQDFYEVWRGGGPPLHLTQAFYEVWYEPVAPMTTQYAIRRQRRFPHVSSLQEWVFCSRLQIDLQPGVGLIDGLGSNPQVMLRISRDGGATWGPELYASAGAMGQYTARVFWTRLGRARDFVFEVTVSDPVKWVFLNAYGWFNGSQEPVPIPGFAGPTNPLRSRNVDAELTINLFTERANAGTPKVQSALYGTPGLLDFAVLSLGAAAVRGVFAQDGRAFAVAGNGFYEVFDDGTWTLHGIVNEDGHPAQMASNGTGGQQVLVTSAGNGYIFDLSTDAFALIADPDFPVDVVNPAYIDGYFTVQVRNSRQFAWSALEDGTSWDLLDIAERIIGSDDITQAIRVHRGLYLLGSRTSEVWFTTPDPAAPFAPDQSAFLEQGAAVRYAAVRVDNTICWIGQNENGFGVVYRADGYTPSRISTDAIEAYLQTSTDIADTFAFAYQQNGHTFYVLNVPDLDKTPVYDASTNEWHFWAFWNSTTCEWERTLAHCHMFAFEKHLVGSRANGVIYELSPSTYTDGVIT